ncbi:hypothetical protein [Pinirhizobacter sp.]|jgi:hypothetical protein|uniref:hypothetical protein n=1 Tax=Pinirhizobacter sp. TaxID=2950432 RepID=UPI002F41AB3C
MPKATNASSASNLSARCFHRPWEGSRTASTSGQRALPCGELKFRDWIEEALNVPPPLAPGTTSVEQRIGGVVLTQKSRSRHADPADDNWIIRTRCLAGSIHCRGNDKNDFIRWALLATAAVSSTYWRQFRDDKALCVLDTDGGVLCRASAATDGCIDMTDTDAVIQLTDDGPQPHGSMVLTKTSGAHGAEAFSRAAVHAARRDLAAITYYSTAEYSEIIAHHGTKLCTAMSVWIKDHRDDLTQIIAKILAPTEHTTPRRTGEGAQPPRP